MREKGLLQRLRESTSAKLVGGAVTLTSLVGCPQPIQVDTSQLPANQNIVCEEDVQKPIEERPLDGGKPVGYYPFTVIPGYEGQPVVVDVRATSGNRDAPFDTKVVTNVGPNGAKSGYIAIDDNDKDDFKNGDDVWVISIRGAAYLGEGISSDPDSFRVVYTRCSQFEGSQGPVGPQGPSGTPGQQPEPPYKPAPNNGTCDVGETWRDEYACLPSSEEVRNKVILYFTDSSGNELPRNVPNVPTAQRMYTPNANYFAVAEIDPDYADYLRRINSSPRITLKQKGEDLSENCIHTSTSPQEVISYSVGSMQIRAPFKLLVPEPCLNRYEDIEASFITTADVPVTFYAGAHYLGLN